jgi:hypothetical protein
MEKYYSEFMKLLKDYPLLSYTYLDTKKIDKKDMLTPNISIDDYLILLKDNPNILELNGYFKKF